MITRKGDNVGLSESNLEKDSKHIHAKPVQTKQTEKPKKAKKHGVFYYAVPGHLKAELDAYDFGFTTKNLLSVYAITIALMALLGLIFKLPWYCLIPLFLFGCLFAPSIAYHSYKNKYEYGRFMDVNVYIEQMLYAFKNSQKILVSLNDVRVLFERGTAMRKVLDEACEIILDPNSASDNENIEEKALKVIEAKYPNDYIRSLHRFMLKVESIGGDFDSSIELLLQNREMWDLRVHTISDKRKAKRGEVLGSCLASIGMCAMMLYILPSDVDIAGMLVAQIAHVLLIGIMTAIYVKADKQLCLDLITSLHKNTDQQIIDSYYKYLNYNPAAELKKSLILAIFPAIFVIAGFFLKNTIMVLIASMFVFIMLTQHKWGHSMLGKRLRNEIIKAYPQWLMELALLLQSDNVHVALFKTVDDALPIMKPELQRMEKALLEEPNSDKPFFNFFREFNIPEVTTSMKMLYSLSIGTGGDPAEQLVHIICRNNSMLNRAEQKADDDSLASMYTLFLMPILVCGVILTIDMGMFLMSFFANVGF